MFITSDDIQLTYTQWKICYYYDMQEYVREMGAITKCLKQITSICNDKLITNETITQQICTITIRQIEQHIQNILEKQNVINSHNILKEDKISRKTQSSFKLCRRYYVISIWYTWLFRCTIICRIYKQPKKGRKLPTITSSRRVC